MRLVHHLVLASTNRHKLEEFQQLFKPHLGVEIVSAEEYIRNASKIGMVEKYNTYLENAVAKARLANQGVHYPCLADDSGLEIDVLEGRPGVKSARYSIPKAGQSRDQSNMDKVLTELKGVPMANRSAKFVCTLALVLEGILITATGELKGTIAEAPSGREGFGYDPIFIPEGMNQTLAEIGSEKKNKISHRARAVQQLVAQLSASGIALAKP